MRQAWAAGKFDGRRRRSEYGHPRAWMPEQDAWLRAHIGTRPAYELVEPFLARFGQERTEKALLVRCKRLGISHYMQGWPLIAVEALFGVDHRAIARWWLQPGLLNGRRWKGRGRNAGWWFELEDIERFCREHPYAYDVSRMDPGRVAGPLRAEARRLKGIAELICRSDRWLPYAALERYCCVAEGVLDKWLKRGLVPHKRRLGAGRAGEIFVRATDFPRIAQNINDERIRRQRRPDVWTPEEDRWLADHLGTRPTSELVGPFKERFGRARSKLALEHRGQRLGLSRRVGHPEGTWVAVKRTRRWIGWRLVVAQDLELAS